MKRWGIVLVTTVILMIVGVALYVATRPVANDNTSAHLSVDTQAPTIQPGAAGRLSAWVFGGDIPTAVWDRILTEFQRTSGFLVQVTAFESEEKYRTALRLALAEHRLPDVFLIDATEAEALRKAGQVALLDLEPSDAAEWVPGALGAFRRGEKTLAFPSEFTALALYYNLSSFDRIGVAYPDVHWTWETLLAISQAVYVPAGGDRTEPLYAIELPLRFDVWQAFSCQAGGGLYEGATWQVGSGKALGPQLKSLTYLRDFLRRYVIVPRPPSAESGRLFAQGRASMAIAGAELMRELRTNPGLRWGVAPLPKGETRATVLRARGWAVSALSQKPEGAARLARAFASQPSRAGWLSAQAPRAGTQRSSSEQVFYDSAAYAQPPLALATGPELEKIINEELLRWISQSEPSPQVLIDWVQATFKP